MNLSTKPTNKNRNYLQTITRDVTGLSNKWNLLPPFRECGSVDTKRTGSRHNDLCCPQHSWAPASVGVTTVEGLLD